MTATSKVTKEKLFSQVHANIYNLLNDRTNVPDPYDSTGARKFVYEREPLTLGRGFAGYPLIIIPKTRINQSLGVLSGTKNNLRYRITIKIITIDSNNFPSQGAATLDIISDNVVKVINANDAALRNYGMKNHEFDTDYDWIEIDGRPVYLRTISLEFNQLQTVS